MWNRVALLAAGVAFGWSLVTWLSTTEDSLGAARTNSAIAALAGLAVIVWLGVENPSAAIVGTLVLALGSLVAYAAHAKQILRPPDPAALAPAAEPIQERPEPLAALLVPGPPPRYSPSAMARLQAPGALPTRFTRRWFLAPAAFRRVRRAYQRHQPLPLVQAIEATRDGLQKRLGVGWHVAVVHLNDDPILEQRILSWQALGYRNVVLLPVDISKDERASLVSSLRQISLETMSSPRLAPITRVLPDGIYQDTVAAMADEKPPPPCRPSSPAVVEELARHVEGSLP